MNTLLAISIGPVQDFIAASRRLGDLTAGSVLLTEIASAVAKEVTKQGGNLIFPAAPDADGPNKILAMLTDNDAASVAQAAQHAASALLVLRWEAALKTIGAGVVDEELARQQIAQFLEFYAAWSPCPEGTYAEARLRVDRLLAGRKALRDFKQPPTRAGQPKSPLDPSRECVLNLHDSLTVPEAAKQAPLYLNAGETLDAISLLKRVEGRASKAPSTALVAAQSMLRACDPEIRKALEAIAGDAGGDADLGDLIFDNRLDDLSASTRDKLQSRWPEILALRHKACESAGIHACSPYYAVIVADGDKMGKMLGAMQTPDEHRAFSSRLAEFATSARNIVKQYYGAPIYTGGDDVLALLPLVTAIPCSAALATAFKQAMANDSTAERDTTPSLSAGLAIVHFMEPLQVALRFARDAEKLAKIDRNSIAIALHTRGGAPITVFNRWESDPGKVVATWNTFADMQQSDELSRGFPYEMKALVAEWPNDKDTAKLNRDVLKKEVERILKRKKGSDLRDGTEQLYLELSSLNTRDEFAALADWLIIARFLTSNTPRREPVNA